MAIKATIYKASLNIADMDRNYYVQHSFTIAKHSSETELRLMARLVAFMLNADEELLFTKGISQDDEPDLWQKALNGDIKLWIDLGQPDEKRIRKACGRAESVIIYMYQEGSAVAWWKQMQSTLGRFKNLSVRYLKIDGDIESLANRTMDLQCNIIDRELSVIEGDKSITVNQEIWK